MPPVPQRSTFVTVVAWIFIVLSGFNTVISVLQNLMFGIVLGPEFAQAMREIPSDSGMPPWAPFLFGHIQLILLVFLLVSVFMLVSSIGLLRRWNWARLCFVGLMVLGIVGQLAGAGFQIFMFSSVRDQFSADFSAQGGPDISLFFVLVSAMSALFVLGFCVLFGWIVKKLLSAPIVAEFRG